MAERRPRPERRREGIKSDRLAVVLPLLGPRAATPGVAANSGPSIDVSSTAHCAASTGRAPGLGGVSSSPVHRAFVLVLGTNIAVLLDCSKSSGQCSLSYLLTYLRTDKNLCRCFGAPARRVFPDQLTYLLTITSIVQWNYHESPYNETVRKPLLWWMSIPGPGDHLGPRTRLRS